MRTIQAKKLTMEAFAPYGSFVNFTEPTGYHLGDFYRDPALMSVSGALPIAFSPLVMHKSDKMVVDTAEYHNSTAEALLPIDDDIVIHVAPASNKPVPELTEAFIVPMGTMVILKLGTWHYGGFARNKKDAHTMVVLPERIYMNDCIVVPYEEKDQMEIVL